MGQNAEMGCAACKVRVPLHEMKYSKDGSGLICARCSDRQGSGVKLKIRENTFTRPVEFVPKKKIVFLCTACNYRFKRGTDFRGPRECPNCSRSDTVRYDLPSDANALMRELDRLDI